MKKKPVSSLRFRIIASVLSVLFLLLLLIIVNNVYAIRIIRNQAYNLNKNTLSMYINQIDAAFSDVETYMAVYSYDNSNLVSIENPNREIDRYITLYREEQNLHKTIAGYNMIDGLFIYSKPGPFFIDSVQTRISTNERNEMKKYLTHLLDTDDSIIAKNAGHWFSLNHCSEYYICRILKVRDTYIGAWVKTKTLTQQLIRTGFDQTNFLFFCNGEGAPLDIDLYEKGLTIPNDKKISRFGMSGGNDRYLIVSQPLQQGPYSLVALIPDNSILQRLGAFGPILFVLIIGILLTTALLAVIMNKFMVQPLNRLADAIISLKSGNLDAQIVEKNPCQEFIEVNQAFHDMTAQIKHLTIDVYEEKLIRQNIQLLYLQQQIAPHFLINCLSSIYSLAGTGKNSLVQQISLDLSSHLRYKLSNSVTVALWDELEHVQNFINLSQTRFPECIAYELSVANDILDARIPMLMLQTFVENTIKYEVTAGTLVTIHISGKKVISDNIEQVHITIWDTGDGFTEDILQKLVTGELKPLKNGHQIGIHNVIQRLGLLYKDNYGISFSNREDAGAMIEITIPYLIETSN